MESQVRQTQVQDVDTRTVTRRSDGQQFTIHEVSMADGSKWTTNQQRLADAARELIGQAVLLKGKTKQNGKFINYYLDELQPMPSLPDVRTAIQTHAQTLGYPVPNVTPPNVTITTGGAASTYGLSTPTLNGDARQDAIHRQTAAKVSARLSATPEEFWANLDALVAYFATGEKPAFGAERVGDDDIPF